MTDSDCMMEVSTEAYQGYRFFPIFNGSVDFQVRAQKATIILSRAPKTIKCEFSKPYYAIYIGSKETTMSKIVRSDDDRFTAEDTPEILSPYEFRRFWIRWENGTIYVGRACEKTAFMHWTDSQPFQIGYISVAAANGSWIIGDGAEFETTGDDKYICQPITSGSLKFDFQGARDCFISLTNLPREEGSIHTFIIGGWGNQTSCIGIHGAPGEDNMASTENILDEKKFKSFSIDWCSNGRITARDLTTGNIIVSGMDERPFIFRYFAIATRTNCLWRFKNYKHLPTTSDCYE